MFSILLELLSSRYNIKLPPDEVPARTETTVVVGCRIFYITHPHPHPLVYVVKLNLYAKQNIV